MYFDNSNEVEFGFSLNSEHPQLRGVDQVKTMQRLTLWIAPLYSVCCTAAVHLCKTMRILQEIKPLIFESVASLALA